MSQIERYRKLYEYEKDCDSKMLAMLESVPDASRGDARFKQAITIAAHLAICRENWLDHMAGEGRNQVSWQDEQQDPATLSSRFVALESLWTDYLARLEETQLSQDFVFTEDNEESFSVPIEVQIEQLAGHAAYHRGQIALLVIQLGGKTTDTDYVDWWWTNRQP